MSETSSAIPLGEWTINRVYSTYLDKVYYRLICVECGYEHLHYLIALEKITECMGCSKEIPPAVLGYMVICRAS